MTIEHNLEDVLDPETIDRYFGDNGQLNHHEFTELPFIRAEFGFGDAKINFWDPKDTATEGNESSLSTEYSSAFMRYCGGGNRRSNIFPLMIAEMVKNGRIGELESLFLEDIAYYALKGMALEHLASWAISGGP